jgi:serine/threonine-protein kinase RsbW
MNLDLTTFELSMPGQLGCEKLVRHMIGWLGPRLNFSSARVADIQTAVSEACINAIEHGNQGRAQLRVTVIFTITHNHLEAVILDAGITQYRPSTMPPASIHDKIADRASARGMGLMLIGALADEAEFLAPVPGQGNRFRIRFSRVHSGASVGSIA